MAEKETVIKWLDVCSRDEDCKGCPYDNAGCFTHLMMDAATLLKEREHCNMDYMPKKGSWIRHGEPPQYVVECSRCGNKYFNHALQPFAKYCSMCGAKMESWIVDDQMEAT